MLAAAGISTGRHINLTCLMAKGLMVGGGAVKTGGTNCLFLSLMPEGRVAVKFNFHPGLPGWAGT